MLMSRDHHGVKEMITSVKIIDVCKGGSLKIFGATQTNQNSIRVKMKSRLKSGNAC